MSPSPETDVSSLTDPSPPRAKHPPPIVLQVQKTTADTQRTRANKKILSHHDKAAFKAATALLDTERKKTDGMGAWKVAAQIKEDWQVDISFRTLSRGISDSLDTGGLACTLAIDGTKVAQAKKISQKYKAII